MTSNFSEKVEENSKFSLRYEPGVIRVTFSQRTCGGAGTGVPGLSLRFFVDGASGDGDLGSSLRPATGKLSGSETKIK